MLVKILESLFLFFLIQYCVYYIIFNLILMLGIFFIQYSKLGLEVGGFYS